MKKYRVKVYRDQDPCDPREDSYQFGTMVYWHDRYKLGDEQPSESPKDWQIGLADPSGKLEERVDKLYEDSYMYPNGSREWREYLCEADNLAEKLIVEAWDKLYISLPLYLYDHSGISMSTGKFSCPWDSGQVGFIYVSKEKARECWDWDRLTPSRVHKVLEHLQAEVEEYDAYLRGEVYGFHIEKRVPAPFPCPTCGHADEDEWVDTGFGCGGILNINGNLASAILDNLSLDYDITLSDVEQAIDDVIC